MVRFECVKEENHGVSGKSVDERQVQKTTRTYQQSITGPRRLSQAVTAVLTSDSSMLTRFTDLRQDH